MARVTDLLPPGEPDPLSDLPVEAQVEAAPEPTPPETQEAEPQPEPALDQEEETYRKRYDDLRALQTRTARDREAAIRDRDEALRLAREAYEAAQRIPAQPTGLSPDQIAEANRRGIDQDQLQFIEQLAGRTADERTAGIAAQLQQYQAQMANQQVEQQRLSVINQFRQQHPDALEHEEEIVGFLRDVDMVNEYGAFNSTDLSARDLEAAWEAVQDPDLAFQLRANKHWYDTSEGMALAKQQASLLKLLKSTETTTSAAPSSAQATEAALAAAQTLPASAGPPQTSGGSPQGDEFDEVLAYDRAQRNRSVFSS